MEAVLGYKSTRPSFDLNTPLTHPSDTQTRLSMIQTYKRYITQPRVSSLTHAPGSPWIQETRVRIRHVQWFWRESRSWRVGPRRGHSGAQGAEPVSSSTPQHHVSVFHPSRLLAYNTNHFYDSAAGRSQHLRSTRTVRVAFVRRRRPRPRASYHRL